MQQKRVSICDQKVIRFLLFTDTFFKIWIGRLKPINVQNSAALNSNSGFQTRVSKFIEIFIFGKKDQ
jgi:hypothetical protein